MSFSVFICKDFSEA